MPIYYNLHITSVYEYLELRFGITSRRICTVIFIIQSMLYNGIVIYAPALALNEVAGLGKLNRFTQLFMKFGIFSRKIY